MSTPPALASPPPPIPGIAQAFTLDPSVVYLNHGSFGACPRPVLEAQRELQARLEREPYRFFTRELAPLLDAARHELAAFVKADPDGVAFVQNASHGVNTVLRSIELSPGDEILTTNHEYNASKNALDYVAERAGATVVVAHVPFPVTDEEGIVAPILERVTPRTRLAVLDHVTSQTALVFPMARLVSELRARGVETLVDGAHAVGMLPLDLTALGAAYFTSNCHKWLCAPKGCAFLYVRDDVRQRVAPLSISHGLNTVDPSRSRFRLLFDWTGTDDPSAFLSVPAALRFLSSVMPGGVHALAERNHVLVVWARAEIARALGVAMPSPPEMLGTMASLPLDGAPGLTSPFEIDSLQAELLDRFRIEVPVLTWPEGDRRRRALRISAQAYNEPSHYEALASALRQLA